METQENKIEDLETKRILLKGRVDKFQGDLESLRGFLPGLKENNQNLDILISDIKDMMNERTKNHEMQQEFLKKQIQQSDAKLDFLKKEEEGLHYIRINLLEEQGLINANYTDRNCESSDDDNEH